MKHMIALLLGLALNFSSAQAAVVSGDLQATILHPAYGQAAALALKASKAAGYNTTLLGETSLVRLSGPRSVLYIPVYSVQAPMGPNTRKLVGYITSHLIIEPNSPVPACEGVYFMPADAHP